MRDLGLQNRADVDIHLGLDFAGGGHDRRQIFTHDLAGLYRDHALAALLHREAHDGQQNHDYTGDQCEFFPAFHRTSTRIALCTDQTVYVRSETV